MSNNNAPPFERGIPLAVLKEEFPNIPLQQLDRDFPRWLNILAINMFADTDKYAQANVGIVRAAVKHINNGGYFPDET